MKQFKIFKTFLNLQMAAQSNQITSINSLQQPCLGKTLAAAKLLLPIACISAPVGVQVGMVIRLVAHIWICDGPAKIATLSVTVASLDTQWLANAPPLEKTYKLFWRRIIC